MDIRIGIQNSGRELNFSSAQTAAEIEAAVTKAISDAAPLRLVDDKGAVYFVPSASLAYVELGAEETRRVGFVA